MSFIKKIMFFNKTVGVILMFTVLTPLFYFSFPQKALAQWPVFDIPTEITTTISSVSNTLQTSKELGLDGIAWTISQMIMKKITAQTVNWINSGFKGSPAFLTNPDTFFMNIGDNVASRYLSETSLSKLCTPFQAKVRLALVKNYLTDTQQKGACTLGLIENNFDNFTNEFSQGGWDAFFTVSQNSQNNPYGTYLNTRNELAINTQIANEKYNKQLDWGKGFLSYERCIPGTEQQPSDIKNGLINNLETRECKTWDLNSVPINPVTKLPEGSPTKCLEYYPTTNTAIDTGIDVGDCAASDKETVTPGSVINDQLEKVFGSSIDKLSAADELNEIFSALLGQLTDALVGGIGNGLKGLTEKSPTNPRSFYDQISPGSTESNKEYNAQTGTIQSGVDKFVGQIDKGVTTIQNNQPQTANVPDTPFISLKGNSPMTIPVGVKFVDPGVTAIDPVKNVTLSVTTSGFVNENVAGTYTITYTATNAQGSASVKRVVNVSQIAP